MTVSSFDPFTTFDRLFRRAAGTGMLGRESFSLPMDVYRKGEEFVVELDVPGVDPSAIDMTVERNMLTVSGEVEPRHEDVDEVVVCERPHTRFRRQIYLGENLDTERIRASYDSGVLTIRIPVSEQQRARKIEVAAEQQQRGSIDVGSSEREGGTRRGGKQS